MNALLQELISQEVARIFESFRGFNLSVFKNMDSEKKRIEYALDKLPVMGSGSARSVFAIGAGKVLKMAGSYRFLLSSLNPEKQYMKKVWSASIENGYLQNKAEIDLYTHPEARPILAKIFNFADDYSWLVAEAAQPLEDPDELTKHLGIPMPYITDVLEAFKKTGNQITDSDLEELVESFWHSSYARREFSELAGREIETEEDMQIYLEKVFTEHYIFSAVIHLVTKLGHSPYDLNNPEHWGKTSDGRLVLLDYGFTDEVREKY